MQSVEALVDAGLSILVVFVPKFTGISENAKDSPGFALWLPKEITFRQIKSEYLGPSYKNSQWKFYKKSKDEWDLEVPLDSKPDFAKEYSFK